MKHRDKKIPFIKRNNIVNRNLFDIKKRTPKRGVLNQKYLTKNIYYIIDVNIEIGLNCSCLTN